MIGFGSITFLSTLAYYGKVRLYPRKLLTCVSGCVLFGLLLGGGAWGLGGIMKTGTPDPRPAFSLAPKVTQGIDVTLYRNQAQWKANAVQDTFRPSESTRRALNGQEPFAWDTNPKVPPFSYLNRHGDLVGYDIAYAYDLARSLMVLLLVIK